MESKTHQVNEIYKINHEEFRLRTARQEDMDSIKDLYDQVYEGKYTLQEVSNPDKMKWAINDPNYIWLLMEKDGQLASSVIFVVDKKHRLGKSLAGVVTPRYRGHKLMKKSLKYGLDYVFEKKDLVDVVYGVVRTFVSRSFHQDLKDLGFVDVGVFPNVRKVSKYETHGLKIAFKPGALENRKKNPRLIPQAAAIYDIVKKRLNLEDAEVVPYDYVTPGEFKKYHFAMEKSPDIEWKYYEERDSGQLLMSFYPFHYPEIELYTMDEKTRAYIHFEERDGHGDLMGLATDEPENLTDILESIAYYAESIDIKYLELLIDAYNPEIQKKAYEADFLPCAYFPAMEKSKEGEKIDFIVACRTFVPLDFRGIKLTDDNREYVREFFKQWTTKLWKDLEHA